MTQTFQDRVMDTLLARLQSRCGKTFAQYTRRMRDWQQVVAEIEGGEPLKQPMLILFDGVGLGGGYNNIAQRGRGTPSVTTMSRTIVVYARIPDGSTPQGPKGPQMPGGTTLYELYESIEGAFAPDDLSQNVLTLGGLVSHCWIEGDVFYVTGETDPQGQGMLTVPVKIMLYPNSA